MSAFRPVARAAARNASSSSSSSAASAPAIVSTRAALAAVNGSRATTRAATAAPFSTTARRSGGGGGVQYDPPTGWLWGVRPGEKYQNEGWEGPFFYGFWGSIIVAAIAYAWKPDTSIQTWALEEARRRLEAEGILEDPEKKK